MRPRNLLLLAASVCFLSCTTDAPEQDPPKPASPPAEAKKVPAGHNVWLEIQGDRRRVAVQAKVCLREGQLEQLLCRKHTKEHEAILTAEVGARDIHKALLVAGAQPGAPVQYQPKFQPPRGARIRVTVQYEDKGKLVTAPAQSWVRESTSQKALTHDWVFAGSILLPSNEPGREPIYAANSGDVICVSNFEEALLDLPINSPKDNAELSFEAFTERIPPLDTLVKVYLEPVK